MFILSGPTSVPTAKDIARALGVKRYGGYSVRKMFRREPQGSICIRYGFGPPTPRDYFKEINHYGAVKQASNKLRQMARLKDAGVPVPKFVGRAEDLNRLDRSNPIFGRNFHHTRGQDIEIIWPDAEPLYPHDFFTEYVKPKKEWRVHVIGGEIVFAQNKFRTPETMAESMSETGVCDTNHEDAGMYEKVSDHVRCYSYGWRFNTLNDLSNLPVNVRDASIRAVDALGLDFGAVDVISYGRDEDRLRRACVLEVNTAPGLTEESVELYAQSFRTLDEEGNFA